MEMIAAILPRRSRQGKVYSHLILSSHDGSRCDFWYFFFGGDESALRIWNALIMLPRLPGGQVSSAITRAQASTRTNQKSAKKHGHTVRAELDNNSR